MEKLLLKAKRIPTGKPNLLSFEIDDSLEEWGNFLREESHYEKQRKEKEPEYQHFFDLAIQRWYKRRSLQANNLAWELATRLAQADRVSKDVVYYAIKELVDLPRDEYNGVFVSRPSAGLSTVEFARFIQTLVIECQTHEPAVDIRDIWILFTDWRFGQEKDPLEGTYSGPEDYKEKHPCCEACGRYLLFTTNSAMQGHAGQLAHVVSTGAGGADQDWNWLVLCDKCHLDTQHEQGWEELLKTYPHLRAKLDRARSRAGKKPLASPLAREKPKPQAEPPVPAGPATPAVQADQPALPAPVTAAPSVDQDKEAMLAKLQDLQKDAEQKREKYYPKGQKSLFDEPKKEPVPATVPEEPEQTLPIPELVGQEESADPPAPSYNDQGGFEVPPDF